MSKKLFTEDQINLLKNNKYIKRITRKAITYSDEFKKLFVSEYEKGLTARQIFEKYGFDVAALGEKRIKTACSRWYELYKKYGLSRLNDTRKNNLGRPGVDKISTEGLSLAEELKRVKAKNKLLEAENELLKKLDLMERGLMKIE